MSVGWRVGLARHDDAVLDLSMTGVRRETIHTDETEHEVRLGLRIAW